MAIIVFSPYSSNAVKVRDEDANRAVQDEEGRTFYVLPKTDGSGFYGALTRTGSEREEARALELEAKLSVAHKVVHHQVETAQSQVRYGNGLRGKVLVLSAVLLVLIFGGLVFFGPLHPDSLWTRAPIIPPRDIPVDRPSPPQPTDTTTTNNPTPPDGPVHDSADPTLLVLPDGLKYRVNHTGVGDTIKPHDHVQVLYTGMLSNGTKFDISTDPDSPFLLTVGSDRNLKFWNEILPGTTEGEDLTVIVPPSLAYGAKGTSTVPPGETVKFDIKILRKTQ